MATQVVILAAGKGTRMNHPELPKVLVTLKDKPLIWYLLEQIKHLNLPTRMVIVVGFKHDAVESTLGSDYAYTLNALSDTLRKITGTTSAPRYLPTRPLDVLVATSDHAESRKYLGYEDKTGLEEGLLHTWNYAKKQGYQAPIYGGIEIENKQIPKNWRQMQ